MTALLDGRPPGVDAFYRPGKTFTFDMPWAAGALTGRTFEATLNAEVLAVAVDGDTMTVTATAAQTEAAGLGAQAFTLTETTGGIAEAVIIGKWLGSDVASTSGTSGTVIVSPSAGTVTVTVTATDARYHQPNLVVPEGWGATWRRARSETSTRLARVAVIGDSVGTGQYARTISGPRWIGGYPHLLREALQARYGDGGIGWVDVRTNRGIFGGMELGAETGAWTAFGTGGGPNDAARRPTVAGNGATVTFPFDGTILDIITQTATGYGTITYSIDGGAAVPVSQDAASSIQTTTVTGLAPGAHSVTITAATGNSKPVAIRGRNATGVAVDNLSSAGRAYSTGTTGSRFTVAVDGWATETVLSTSITAIDEADVVILCLGLNDLGTTDDVWASTTGWHALGHLYAHTERLARNVGERPDLVIAVPHFGRGEETDTPEAPQLATQLRSFADAVGAAVVDVWALGRHSWDYWDTLGAWPDPFGSGKDNVHPNAIGHELYASLLIDLLTAT